MRTKLKETLGEVIRQLLRPRSDYIPDVPTDKIYFTRDHFASWSEPYRATEIVATYDAENGYNSLRLSNKGEVNIVAITSASPAWSEFNIIEGMDTEEGFFQFSTVYDIDITFDEMKLLLEIYEILRIRI